MAEPPALDRFVAAQAPVWTQVVAELSAGQKVSHWMWFIFPQHQALGRSQTARHFGIVSIDEAKQYLAHPLLGARLKQCTALVLALNGRTAHDIFGTPDDLKFRSSMTLFAAADPEEPRFKAALDKYCDGIADDKTLQLLA